ncbi:hypothetical protein TNCV_3659621 [Trichonephila clavipes]|nr:hypothetical protein TNCV_3659621 [Trichonephila clavipes]
MVITYSQLTYPKFPVFRRFQPEITFDLRNYSNRDLIKAETRTKQDPIGAEALVTEGSRLKTSLFVVTYPIRSMPSKFILARGAS